GSVMGAGPFGTQFDSKVRSSKTSSCNPPRLVRRAGLPLIIGRPESGLAKCAQVRKEKQDRSKTIEILLCCASCESLEVKGACQVDVSPNQCPEVVELSAHSKCVQHRLQTDYQDLGINTV